MLAIPFPMIDPVLVEVGPLAIRWYSLSYIAGILLGWLYIRYLNKKFIPILDKRAFDDIVVWMIVGIILGGRLGYVFFYNPEYYLANPSQIPALWQGGMSFHGGLIGATVALYLFSRAYKLPFLRVTDMICTAAPIGLCLGRIANFINGELYGRVADIPWAVIFPSDPYPRHPSQLYQSFMEGFLLFVILLLITHGTKAASKSGMLSGCFLVGYAIFRSIGEIFREPDAQIGFIAANITMGQILSVPMALLGIYLILRAKKQTA